MINIIIKSITYSPHIFFKAVFQPSQFYNFLNKSNDNKKLFLLSFVYIIVTFSVFFIATPIFYLYKTYYNSLIYIIVFSGTCIVISASICSITGQVAIAGSISGAFAFFSFLLFIFVFPFSYKLSAIFSVAVSGVVFGSITVSIAFSFIGESYRSLKGIPGTVAGAVVGADSETLKESIYGLILFICTVIIGYSIFPFLSQKILPLFICFSSVCGFIIWLGIKKILNISYKIMYIFDMLGWIIIIIAGGGSINAVNDPEVLFFPLSFFLSYFFLSQIRFSHLINMHKIRKIYSLHEIMLIYQKYRAIQVFSFIWCSSIALLFYLPLNFSVLLPINRKLSIISICFLLMPIFILHLPDYFCCVFIWLFQKKKIIQHNSQKKILSSYNKSILFKHEMLFFQLPGLYKLLINIHEKQATDIKESINIINNININTFQNIQSKKAIAAFGVKNDVSHEFIHIVLQKNNTFLLQILYGTNELAELYLMLFEEYIKDINNYELPQNFFFDKQKKNEFIHVPEDYVERIKYVSKKISKFQEYRYSDDISITLNFVYQLIISKNLRNFYNTFILKTNSFINPSIEYIQIFKKIYQELLDITKIVSEIETIDRIQSKHEMINDQKKKIEELLHFIQQNVYEPFKCIWGKVIDHFELLLDNELYLLQGSAFLSINLRNQKLILSSKKNVLYFKISNKGKAYAIDILIKLQADSQSIKFYKSSTFSLKILESNTTKYFSIPVITEKIVDSVVRGTVTFSDNVKKNKLLPFSFPVFAVEEKITTFKKINNLYIAGPALKKNSPLYIDRKDIYQQVDDNILIDRNHHNTIIFYGLRRSGKSSFLYRIAESGFSNKRLIPIYFDMQGIDDEKDFYFSLSDAINKKLAINDSNSKVINFSQFKLYFNQIKLLIDSKIIVLLVDEFEEIQLRVEEGIFSKSIFSNIRHLIQHEDSLIFLFCGSHKLEEMRADYWSVFFNTALYIKINFLNFNETIKLITEPVHGQLTYDKLAIEQIYYMTYGQPYLIQLICRNIINELNKMQNKNMVTIDDVDNIIDIIISKDYDNFSLTLWNESNNLEKLLLSLLADGITHSSTKTVNYEDIKRKINFSIDVTEIECLNSINTMVSKNILNENKMHYSFSVNLFRKWLYLKHPIQKTKILTNKSSKE